MISLALKTVFFKQFVISRLLETWITPDELYGVLLVVMFFNQLSSYFRRFTVKLQNCSVEYNTSPDFISSGGGEEDFISSGGGEEDFLFR